ncbi:MAG: hypothetical protein JTT11_01665 [Candidatus Brockarchaeota archaeon]|nr:hypothetical protein [Candidatus Brockarchaeota archaeon]
MEFKDVFQKAPLDIRDVKFDMANEKYDASSGRSFSSLGLVIETGIA